MSDDPFEVLRHYREFPPQEALIVNLFAGPGAGKSTIAADVYALLKKMGVRAEYVPEWAKEQLWAGIPFPLDSISVWGAQRHRIERVRHQVDVVVTDGPCLLAPVFARLEGTVAVELYPPWLETARRYHASLNTLDVFVERRKEYDGRGRHVDEATALHIDGQVHELLRQLDIKHWHVQGNDAAGARVLELVREA
jgi:hypothetical protein